MTEVNLAGFARRLRLTTEILAADPIEQLGYLHGLGLFDLIDELALQFDDAFVILPQLRREQLVSAEAEAAVQRLDALLSEMTTGPAEVWTEDALRSSPQWSNVRELARTASNLLPAEVDPGGVVTFQDGVAESHGSGTCSEGVGRSAPSE